MSAPGAPKVDATTAAHLVSGGTPLDVREPHEWAAGHAPGARHVPPGGLDANNRTGGMTVWAQAGLPVGTDDGRDGTVE